MVFWVTAVTVAGLLAALLVLGGVMRNASITQTWLGVFWGFGFVVIAWISLLVTDGNGVRTALLVAMATVWGLRLGIYLAFRARNQKMTTRRSQPTPQHSDNSVSFASVSVQGALQSGAMWVIALPLQIGINETSAGWTPLWVIGAAVFVFGFAFEAIGDWQLARFKANPATVGQVCNSGLWRYTRHPNYFGDTAAWWGIGLVAASTPIGIIGLIGPAFNHWTLLKVSGVPALENTLKTKRPGYANYIKQTSAFIPRRPKKL